MLKEDCFAWNRDLGYCIALKETYCRNGECKFYKTAKERCLGCMLQENKNTTCYDNIKNRICLRSA